MTFDAMWAELAGVGRARSGGYRRFAWTREDLAMREWFAASAVARGLDLVVDRAGNQWAWWGDPDATPGIVTGSHLDSVPDGGAFDGPLGVVSAFAALDALRSSGAEPARPLGVVNFADEEGARFGVACAGSRLLTGALAHERALALRDADGVTLAEARAAAGQPVDLGPDPETLRRVATFIELHVEQGKALVDLDRPVGVADSIWPHGRFRVELPGEANHAGTTAIDDRRDPSIDYARFVLAARALSEQLGVLTTCGKVRFEPNGVNAIPSLVTAWLDARGPVASVVEELVAGLGKQVTRAGGSLVEESWTGQTTFDVQLRERLVEVVTGAPRLTTGAGHDAGVLAQHGVPSAMLFVRNPTGVSHSPAEFAERDDCIAGVAALTAVLANLLGGTA